MSYLLSLPERKQNHLFRPWISESSVTENYGDDGKSLSNFKAKESLMHKCAGKENLSFNEQHFSNEEKSQEKLHGVYPYLVKLSPSSSNSNANSLISTFPGKENTQVCREGIKLDEMLFPGKHTYNNWNWMAPGFERLSVNLYHDTENISSSIRAQKFITKEIESWNLQQFGLMTAEEMVRQRTKRLRPKKFRCPNCHIAFSNNGQLKGHIRIHTGERPFKCDYSDCGKTFTRNEELTRHKRIHTGVRPFPCSICKKCFGRKDHLKKHIRTHRRLSAYQFPYIFVDCIY